MQTECIIEHQTRGILMELPGERDEKPHFSWSKPRSEAKRFPTKIAAQVMLPILPHGCYIMRTSDWTEVKP